MVVRGLPLVSVFGTVRDVALECGPDHERTRGLIESANAHQHAAYVRMHDDRVGGFLRKFGAGQCAAGEPLLGVG
jgi:hypothetical protein